LTNEEELSQFIFLFCRRAAILKIKMTADK